MLDEYPKEDLTNFAEIDYYNGKNIQCQKFKMKKMQIITVELIHPMHIQTHSIPSQLLTIPYQWTKK